MLSDTDTVLEVESISKLYSRSSAESRRRLSKFMWRAMAGRPQAPIRELQPGEFWGLKDVSFSLNRGEALGIIGYNGSGKTSLLRILAGQILPDTGEVRMLGRSAAMIDLTAGFQMGASGRENIFLRGAMLGRSRVEMEAMSADIIEFTELADAIEAPVRTYSSGMLMRLAFAIMVASTPDILFIDEILAVGDFRFRQKCLAKIREMRERCAFVLVTHNMQDVKLFCSKVVVLRGGRVAFAGEPEEAITFYETMKERPVTTEKERRSAILAPAFRNDEAIKNVKHFWCDANGVAISEIKAGDPLYFRLSFETTIDSRKLVLGIPVWSETGVYATGFSTEHGTVQFEVKRGESADFVLDVPRVDLNPGVYISNIGIMNGPEFLYRQPNTPLTVLPKRRRNFGIFYHPHEWRRAP